MYVPSPYRIHDVNVIHQILERYSFGTLICDLQASHLAFNIHRDEEGLFVEGHLAIHNPMVERDGQSSLCIFQGPHSYISTSLYERTSVPTWDYISIHAYGVFHLLPMEENRRVVEDLMKQQEHAAFEQWLSAPAKYQDGLQQGIRSFRIRFEKIEAAAKLSQDRSEKEINNIVQFLDDNNKELADWIRYFNS